MKSIDVVCFDSRSYDKEFLTAAAKDTPIRFTFFTERLDTHTTVLAQKVPVVCAFVNDNLSAEVVDDLYRNGTRLIAMRCAGYNNVDLKAAYGKVHVVRVPAYSPHAVAEHTVALILALNRKIPAAYNRTRNGNFALEGLMGFDLYGKTAGILGTGKIGKEVIRILHGLGMRILAYDPYPDLEFATRCETTYTDLETLYRQSDIVSLHLPLNDETYHIIDEAAVNTMKRGVMLINTSRGHLVDTTALIRGLKSGQIGYAGLDVYEEEDKYFFADHSTEVIDDDVLARLLTFPNVIVTAHQAFFTRDALRNIAQTTVHNILAFYEGSPLENEICYHCDNTCRKRHEGRCFNP
ncbi:MAG: 2-hydroxyacid dehydrogenase [Lentisphaerae bacterium]|nr:MAG: 2-hydroxyacid dehydrogenase [Lentisphaerota bacterium]